MAIDTRNKRASTLAMNISALTIFPFPDGSLDPRDRPHSIGLYAGTGFPSYKARLSNTVFERIYPDMIFPDMIYDFDM